MTSFPPVPPEVKSIAHFLKIATEHDDRNVVISYWARMFACQRAMTICPGKKPPDVSKLLIALMDWMEKTKKDNMDNEGITSETTAHALIEEYALKLFEYADAQDRASVFNKNTIKAFYTAGILMDILEQFGNLPEDIHNKRKYAKWKAAYIHNCLKIGDIPIPGAPGEHLDNVVHRADLKSDDEEENKSDEGESSKGATPPAFPTFPVAPPPTIPTPAPGPAAVPPATPPVVVTPTSPSPYVPPSTSTGAALNPTQMERAQKLCKYASSALSYDDVKTAIDNLTKALKLLQTGKED